MNVSGWLARERMDAEAAAARQPGLGYERAKRVLDVSVALAVLVLLAPLWLFIAAAVVLTSPGPAIYRQKAIVGRGGRAFTQFKFRTMYAGSSDRSHREAIARFVGGSGPLAVVDKEGQQRAVFKMVDDPRITPLGKLLRRTGLDEVPQFVNVLRGEMSIVGPRAPLRYEYELYGEAAKHRLSVLPGITGWYQIHGRSVVPFEEMLRLDEEYIRNRSLALDIRIMLQTPWIMISGKGGY